MNGILKTIFLFLLIVVVTLQVAVAYDVPTRRIEVKPYLNFLMPSDFWVDETGFSLVEDKTGIGFGAKIRTQIIGNFGMVLNASLTDIEVVDDSYGSSMVLTFGGFYTESTSLGNFTMDLGYGFVTAGHEATGLLMPSLEYSRPISERFAISFELGWPIVNDWAREYRFKENFSSIAFSLGATLIF
jgi:hypothetical protein